MLGDHDSVHTKVIEPFCLSGEDTESEEGHGSRRRPPDLCPVSRSCPPWPTLTSVSLFFFQTEPVAGEAAEQGQAGPCPQGRPSPSPAPVPGSPSGSPAGPTMTSEPTSPPVVPPLHSPKSPVWPTFPFHREGSRVWERSSVTSRDLPSPLPTKRTRTYSA